MDHVNIISQEAITTGLLWPVLVVGAVALFFILWSLILCVKEINKGHMYITDDKPIRLLSYGFACVPIMFFTILICTIFFPVETGRYKYEGTLDPDMTIVEFEEFQQQYSNVRFEDGVWKWEDK